MSNALFLSSRALDQATVVASSEANLLPATNLQDMRPDKVWRALGCTAEYVTIDLGETVAANAAAIVAHNGAAGVTFRVRGAATAADVTALPAVDTTAVSGWPVTGKPADAEWPSYFSLLTWSNAVAYRYWRIDIADAANPAGYFEAGRLFLGAKFTPAANVDLNLGLGLTTPGQVTRTPYGKTYTDNRGAAARALSLSMSSVTQRELLDSLFDLQRHCGVDRDFAFCLDPAETTDFHRFSMQALFGGPAAAQAQALWDSGNVQIWQTGLTLNEVL